MHAASKAALRIAYDSGMPQLVFVVVFLGCSGRPARLDEFMRLFIAATLLTILVSGPFPASGPWKYYSVPAHVDVSALSHFEPLRDGSVRHIPLGDMQGLISIPSLHTAMAILFIYALRGCGLLFPLFAALNIGMIASTPIEGGHYFVDVLAGAALAVGLIVLSRRRNSASRSAVAARPRSTALTGAVGR